MSLCLTLLSALTAIATLPLSVNASTSQYIPKTSRSLSDSLEGKSARLLLNGNNWGPSYLACSEGGDAWIRWATATLVLPKVPAHSNESTALWSWLITEGWYFTQSLAISEDRQDWTVFEQTAQAPKYPGHTPPATYDAKHAKEGDKITMRCKSSWLLDLQNIQTL